MTAQAQTPSFTAAGVVNAASLAAGPIAPGERVLINGANLGDAFGFRNCAVTYPVGTKCFGTMVMVNGTPAPVINTTPTQVAFQVPFGITGSTATIQVTSDLSGSTLSSATANVPVAPTAPALFTLNGSGSGTGYYFVNSGLVTRTSQPVQQGDTVVLLGTGFGATNTPVATGALGPNNPAGASANVTMTINNQSVPVTLAALEPGNVTGAALGYYEVIFTVPSGLNVPAGQATAAFPVVVTVGGVASPPVNLTVAPPPPNISSVSPNPVPLSSSPQTVTFTGTGFQSGLTLVVAGPNGQANIPAANVTYISATQFSVQLTTGTTAGTWSLIATNPNGASSDTFVFLASGAPPPVSITSVVTTSSNVPVFSQNTWIEVHGTNLSPNTTTWNSLPASAFQTSLPTSLAGVSATVNNKQAAVFYVSPTQVNILAPFDTATGVVSVVVTTPAGQSNSFSATEVLLSPAFLVIDAPNGHVAAQHLPDYSLLGPASLSQPGYTFTPARANETVVLYATGFGQTATPSTDQLKGTGPLPTPWPTVTIGGMPATVSYAGLAASGLYQLNVVVPAGLPAGDAVLTASYNSQSTQSKVYLTIGQ